MPTPLGQSIPYGFCHCGCGNLAPIAKHNFGHLSILKGEPMKYIQAHINLQRPVIEDAQPFKIEDVYCRLIPLTNGLWTIVDAADYKWLMQWKWMAHYSKNTRGHYAQRMERGPDGKQHTVHMHRVILGLDRDDPNHGDHRNRCGIDNRRKNLRPADDDQNAQNASIRKDNTSGVKGVHWHKAERKWTATICFQGKKRTLGYFHELDEAKAAYEKAALELHKEFANFS